MKLSKQREQAADNISEMFGYEAEDESYKRYKHRCYRNLVLKSLLTFVLGMLVSAVFKMLLQ